MNKRRFKILLLFFSILINCQSNKGENKDISIDDKISEIYKEYKENLQYKGEAIHLFEEITITKISYPSFFAGFIATAVEINTINKNMEIDNYYLFYIVPAEQIREMLLVGRQYIFYYDIREIKFNVFAGEEMRDIGFTKTKWLIKYLEI